MKFILLLGFTSLILLSCSDNDEIRRLKNLNKSLSEKLTGKQKALDIAQKSQVKFQFLQKQLADVKAKIETNYGTMEFKFYPEHAPLHVFTFVTRAEAGYYDGTLFHRVIEGFMIQGGDANTKKGKNKSLPPGSGNPLVMIPHEFNTLKHTPGILSTARMSDKSIGAGSQFFIMHAVKPHLDNNYTVFGEITSGMDVVNKIATVEKKPNKNTRGPLSSPKRDVRIKKVTVYR